MGPVVSTVAFEGIEARAVDVQVQVAPGLSAFGKRGDRRAWAAADNLYWARVFEAPGLGSFWSRPRAEKGPSQIAKGGSSWVRNSVGGYQIG